MAKCTICGRDYQEHLINKSGYCKNCQSEYYKRHILRRSFSIKDLREEKHRVSQPKLDFTTDGEIKIGDKVHFIRLDKLYTGVVSRIDTTEDAVKGKTIKMVVDCNINEQKKSYCIIKNDLYTSKEQLVKAISIN